MGMVVRATRVPTNSSTARTARTNCKRRESKARAIPPKNRTDAKMTVRRT